MKRAEWGRHGRAGLLPHCCRQLPTAVDLCTASRRAAALACNCLYATAGALRAGRAGCRVQRRHGCRWRGLERSGRSPASVRRRSASPPALIRAADSPLLLEKAAFAAPLAPCISASPNGQAAALQRDRRRSDSSVQPPPRTGPAACNCLQPAPLPHPAALAWVRPSGQWSCFRGRQPRRPPPGPRLPAARPAAAHAGPPPLPARSPSQGAPAPWAAWTGARRWAPWRQDS